MLRLTSRHPVCAICYLAFISLLLSACSPSKPETTVETFYHAVAKLDVDKATELIALDDVPASEVFKVKGVLQMGMLGLAARIKGNDGIKHIEVLESEVDAADKRARVRIKLIFNNGQEQVKVEHLRLEYGKWKIAFQ